MPPRISHFLSAQVCPALINAVTEQNLMITTSSCTVDGKATFTAVNAKIAKKQIA